MQFDGYQPDGLFDELFQASGLPRPAGGLHEYLGEFQLNMNEIGAAVFENFFALKPVSTADSRSLPS